VAPNLATSPRVRTAGSRFVVDAVLPPRADSDLLHDRNGALADERDRHRVGAHAVARGAAGGWEALARRLSSTT